MNRLALLVIVAMLMMMQPFGPAAAMAGPIGAFAGEGVASYNSTSVRVDQPDDAPSNSTCVESPIYVAASSNAFGGYDVSWSLPMCRMITQRWAAVEGSPSEGFYASSDAGCESSTLSISPLGRTTTFHYRYVDNCGDTHRERVIEGTVDFRSLVPG